MGVLFRLSRAKRNILMAAKSLVSMPIGVYMALCQKHHQSLKYRRNRKKMLPSFPTLMHVLPPIRLMKFRIMSISRGNGFNAFAKDFKTTHVVYNQRIKNKLDRFFVCVQSEKYCFRYLHKMVTSEDRKSTRLNSSHIQKSRMPSSA